VFRCGQHYLAALPSHEVVVVGVDPSNAPAWPVTGLVDGVVLVGEPRDAGA
jgi:hypothetical protein